MIASDIGLDDLSLGYNAPMDSCSLILGRAVTGGGNDLPSALALAVDRGSNRLAGAGYYHDVLGNLVEMPAADGVGTVSMAYLDQGHIGTLTDAAGDIWKYYYDADGKRRIKVKTAGGAATRVDAQGNVVFVDDRSFYFYEGEDLIGQQDVGGLVARIPGTDDIDESVYEPKFLLLDHLGSTRAELVFTDSGGAFVPVIQEYYDLMPYGEVIAPPTTQESVLFTGKPKDIESGLTFFGARYYSDQLCRWPSPDPLFIKKQNILNPQSWNLYGYVLNNPIRFNDPTGLYDFDPSATAKQKKEFEANLKKAQEARDSIKDKTSKEYQKLDKALTMYGTVGDGNGIVVKFDKNMSSPGKVDQSTLKYDSNGNLAGATVFFMPGEVMAEHVAHEGTHLSNFQDASRGVTQIDPYNFDYWNEVSAYHTSFLVSKQLNGSNLETFKADGVVLWSQQSSFFNNLDNLNKMLQKEYGFKNIAPPADIQTFLESGN